MPCELCACFSRAGLDYRHGTGHGVGSYLNVHEGPEVGACLSPSPVLECCLLHSFGNVALVRAFARDVGFGLHRASG